MRSCAAAGLIEAEHQENGQHVPKAINSLDI